MKSGAGIGGGFLGANQTVVVFGPATAGIPLRKRLRTMRINVMLLLAKFL